MIEGGGRADYTAPDRHRMRVAAKTAIDRVNLLVQHRVMRNVAGEFGFLGGGGQIAVEQKPAHIEVIAALDDLIDRITPEEQDAVVAVDISDRRAAGAGLAERRVVGPAACLLT